MYRTPIKTWILFCALFYSWAAMGQYLPNPSFEGIPQPHIPPPGWEICTSGWSTPDTQPGNFGVYFPPSHGSTYLGMTARDDYTWEDVHAGFDLPLSPDSCYIFNIDLAFQQIVNFLTMSPITVKIYADDGICLKNNLLWQSPPISSDEWITYEFPIQPEYEFTDLVLEAYYTGSSAYWGYILIDNIVITTSPDVDLGNDTTLVFCEMDSLVLDPGSGYSGYLWVDGSTDSILVVDTTGTYWVQVFNQYGCSAIDTIEVVIEEYLPLETEMIDSTVVCKGQEVFIEVEPVNGAGPYTFEWLGLEDTLSTITITVDSTMYFYVTVTDKCGHIVMDSIKIVTLPGPEIDLGEDELICSGDTAVLNAGSGYLSYQWQNGSQDSSILAMNQGWYWVIVTGPGGCTSIDSVYVDTYPPISLDLGSDTLMCQFSSFTLDPGPGFTSYLWQDSTNNQTITISSTGNYWVTVTDVNGCKATDSISVEISPAVNVSLGGDTTICSGQNFYLSPGGSFVTYQWQNGSTGSSMNVTSAGTYWVYVTDLNGCSGSDTVNVGINPSPQVDLGLDTVICEGQFIFLDPGQYSSYLWQDNSTLAYYNATMTGVYSVTVTNSYSCEASDEIFVEVISASVNLGQDTLVCEGTSITLDAGPDFSTYLWNDNSSQQFNTIDTSGLYFVNVVNSYGCQGGDTIMIDYAPLPFASLGPDQELCEGDTLMLTATEGPFTYLWNGVNGDASIHITQGGTYTLEVSNQCGSETDQVTILEVERRDVDLGTDQVLLPGESLNLDAGAGYDSYIWQDGSFNQYYHVLAESIDPDNPFYFVEVVEGPCKSSDTVRIEIFEVKVPTVITPNGDGANDIFKPFEDTWNGINHHHISVFNRWGEEVWKSDNFEEGWDGKRNGKFVADGTYFWILEVFYGPQDINQTIKGTLSVIGQNF